MKKKYVIAFVIFFVGTVTASAQLKVNSDGTVRAGTPMTYGNSHITLSSYSTSSLYTETKLVGLFGDAAVSDRVGISCGVHGRAYNDLAGMNYGVVGEISDGSTGGAGVLGGTTSMPGYLIYGKYAGYFYGNAAVTGTLSYGQLSQLSDLRLKENIVSLTSQKESALEKVLDMNVIRYNYKKMIPSIKQPDSVSVDKFVEEAGLNTDKKHIGLIAQELQKLYPELVEEGQDGYLGVNYVELVPVLIRAIQELKQELDEVKGGADETKKTRSDATAINTSSIAFTSNVLYQNTPNPFKEKTIIRFSLAPDVQNAAVCIFDMSGKMLKTLPVSPNDTSVSVNGYELGEGMFLYSLLVNGQEIDTKRMIISK